MLPRKPVTTIAPLSVGVVASPGAAAGCCALGSPGAVATAGGGGGAFGSGWSVAACANAVDGKASANNDEQQPPARSKARRERGEWNKFSLPSSATSASEHSRP